MALVVGENMLTQELADIFAEDSSDDDDFYGFTDQELNKTSNFEHDVFTKKDKAKSKTPFRLRVALRSSAPAAQWSTEEEDVEEEDKPNQSVVSEQKEGQVKSKDEDAAAAARQSEECGFASDQDAKDSFLAKREKNIKANKAMLAQLMADLQKMQGSASLLRNQAGKRKTKEKSLHTPRSTATPPRSRRNPERASRRQTRSMGIDSSPPEAKVELSLEEELLEVQAPRRRVTPRPNQGKPHVIRPVEDVTEEDLQLVAENTTDKVYDSATGSTCHQCRQKTLDTKTCCRSEDCRGIVGQFCGPCLRNRYGEDVRTALLDPEWKCPPCRGICNCSFCRQRDGRCPTGILFPLAKYHGFSDVHSYLSSLRSKLKSGDAEI